MSVLKSTLKMASATFISRILGLVREQVMAAYFGASGMTDAFLVAFRIPNLLRDLFAEGAFSSAFVPTFIETNQVSKEESRELMWSLFWLLTFLTGFICLGIAVFAPELVSLFAPSFRNDPEKFKVCLNLTRIMSPFLTFVSIAALFMGVLNALKVFFLPSLASAWFNVLSIICQLGLSGIMIESGIDPIYSLGIGATLGGFVQAAIQFPAVLKKGYRPLWPKKFWTVKSKKIVTMIGPGLVGFAAAQINLLVTTMLATSTMVGAVSWLNYSFRLFQLPVGILSVSIGNSSLVFFSEAWKKGDEKGAKQSLTESYFLSFFTVMPAFVILFCFSSEIVNLIFERGKFDHSSTLMTSEALRMYALGLPFYGLYKIWVPLFYALDRQKVPVIASLISIGLNIAFCLVLTPIYGFKILALGTTLSMVVNVFIQGIVLQRVLSLDVKFFFHQRLLKVIGASFICALVAKYFLKVEFFSQPFWSKCFILSAQISLTCLLYATLLFILGEGRDLKVMMDKILKKFRRSQNKSTL